MDKIKLGKTDLFVTRTSFGALPIQRISFEDAKKILRKAYDNGINFYDTARGYSDSEEKIGYALSDVRKDIIIATKTFAADKKTLFQHLETSLKNLKTDYVDILQLHNPSKLPDPEDMEGLYQGLIEAREKGLVRYIGITNHRVETAIEAAKSGLYDTIQFPLSSLSADRDIELIKTCKEKNVGLIAMKAMSGGLITNAASTFAFLRQFGNVVPIWGIQRESELDEFLELEKNPPKLDSEMLKLIEKDRKELSGDFCRGCGYCLPCPAKIEIPISARISFLLARSPYKNYMNDTWKEKMNNINNCIECGHCKAHCPYGLDTPNLLKKELVKFNDFYKEHVND
ncbi:MAG TPA: aldo/keto reductase [Clostridiaceae bacterium]